MISVWLAFLFRTLREKARVRNSWDNFKITGSADKSMKITMKTNGSCFFINPGSEQSENEVH